MYLALVLLLGVCCIYVNGNWFFIPTLSILLGLIIIFCPIYIAKYPIFSKIKKYNDFISVGIDFVLLNVLLIVINAYTIINGYGNGWWYVKIALPIICIIYVVLNILLSVRFLRTNKFLKTGIILFLINIFTYTPPTFISSKNLELQQEINDANVFKANLSSWQPNAHLENNVHLIICLTLLLLAVVFSVIGIIKSFRKCK